MGDRVTVGDLKNEDRRGLHEEYRDSQCKAQTFSLGSLGAETAERVERL